MKAETSPIAELRADAQRNRERILAAARDVFADRGPDAATATVARRAGVGLATLYRLFPTRDALVRSAFAPQMQACTRAIAEALAAPDPWHGIRHLVETICALQWQEHGLPTSLLVSVPENTAGQADPELELLVRRAKDAGALRADFHPSDLAMAITAHGALVGVLPDDEAASRRLVAHLLRSFRADAAITPLPPPSTLRLRSLPVAPDR